MNDGTPHHAGQFDAGAAATIADRRSSPREHFGFNATLYPMGGAAPIRCLGTNIGEGGLHVLAPVGFGLAVGQRYEVAVLDPKVGAAGFNQFDEGRYATVIRTEITVGHGGDHVGVSLRFDQPLCL